jgi:hypothetical protein
MPFFTWPESRRVWGKHSFGNSIYHTYYDWFRFQAVTLSATANYEQNIDSVAKDLNGVQVTYSRTTSYCVTINGPPFSPHTTSGGGTTKWRLVFGKGETRYITNTEKGKFPYQEWQQGGGYIWKSSVTSASNNDVREYEVGKAGWPFETWRYKFNNGYTTGSESGRQQAGGYYTGIPTFSGTKTTTGYTILDKTELKQTTGIFKGVIDLALQGLYYRPETQPENFLWVPNVYNFQGEGGRHETLLEEIGVGFYGYRDGFGLLDQNRPILSLAGIAGEATQDNVSETTTTIPASFVRATFTESINGSTTNRAEEAEMGTYLYIDISSKTTTITEYTKSYKNYSVPPIIDTTTTTQIYIARSVKTGQLYEGFVKQEYTKHGYSVSDNVFYKTTWVENPFPVGRGGGGSATVVENWGANTQYYHERSEYGRTLAKWPVNIGRLAQVYETSKAGYYYTDPDVMYKDPTDISTYLRLNTYKCFDGTCIDIKRVANKVFFQTAKTANDSIAFHTFKEPRNAERRLKGTDSLQSILNYGTRTTSVMGGYYIYESPYSGYPSYSKGPFGDSMGYVGQATYKDSYGNIKSTTAYANEGANPEGPAQAGIGRYGFQQDDEFYDVHLPFQQSYI